MELKAMNVHEVKGSCFVYIPKAWVNLMQLRKGDMVVWSVKDGDIKTLQLKKKLKGGDGHFRAIK